MRRRYFIILLGILLWGFNVNFIAVSSAESNKMEELEEVLLKSSQYCSKLAYAVLDFVCKEKVTIDFFAFDDRGALSRFELHAALQHKNFGGGRRQLKYKAKELIYDYQLISKDNKLIEQRILLEVDGKKVSEESDEIEKVLPHSLLILGPIGLLSDYWQERHDYKIKKKGRLLGEKIYVVEAVPKPGSTTKHLWGKIWVSQKDFSILKIEWNQESAEGYESFVKEAKQSGFQPDFSLIAEYEYEKNGIRFPSKFVLEEYYRHPKYKLIKNSKKTVVYYNYKFFTVKTDVIVK